MTALADLPPLEFEAVPINSFGTIEPISRLGGQGRVYRPAQLPVQLSPGPVVIKLYRRAPSATAARVLAEMAEWGRSLAPEERARLHRVAAWPIALVRSGLMPVGVAMEDVSARFAVPFTMPSGRRERVLLALEHLLGEDDYLQLRGLDVRVDTRMRARVAERFCAALGVLHRHGIVASDIAPSNLLVALGAAGPSVCFIDCDSMVFRGRQALEPVETGDWNMPTGFAEPARARAADAYKLALVVLRLFARSHDARVLDPYVRHVPAGLRDLLARGLDRDVANRPPAGEWHRALSGLVDRTDLNERYPGPVGPARATPRQRLTPVGDSAPALAGAGGSRSVRSAPAASSARPAPTGGVWLRPAVVAMWMIAGTAVLALILSRLFAASIPTQNTGGSVSGPQPIYQNYAPQNYAPYQGFGPGGR